MRKTVDGWEVYPENRVWEIVFRYLNPEVSLAEPEIRKVKQIPESSRIWVHQINCWQECQKINRENHPEHKFPEYSIF